MAARDGSPIALSFMEELPDEIILHIFSKIPYPDLIVGARLVCWRWYHLSKDASLWVDVDLSAIKCSCVESGARRIRSGVRTLLYDICSSLERLSFSNLPLDGGIYELFGSVWKRKNKMKFENLKSLDYSFSDVSPRNLRVALTTYPDIEELYLAHTRIPLSQAMEEAIHLPKLKVLVYHDSQSWDNFMDDFMDHHPDEERMINKFNVLKVPKHCQMLERVELHTIRADLDDEVIQQFLKFCTQMTRLSFTWSTNLTAEAFTPVNGCFNHITELGLLDRQETGPYLNSVLPNFPCLTHLTVNGQNVHLEDCIAIGECCPKLKELVFEISSVRNNSGMFEYYLRKGNSLCGLEMQKIAQNCRDLRKLHAPFSNIDDDSVIFLAEQCLFLEDVNFTQCNRLTKDSLFALAKHSISLKKANFQETLIDHKYLLSLVSKCRKLEEVIFDRRPPETSSVDTSLNSSVLSDDLQIEETPESELSLSHSDDIPFIDMTASVEDFDLQRSLLKNFTKKTCGSLNDSGVETVCVPLSPGSHSETHEHHAVKWRHCHVKKLSLNNTIAKQQYLQDIFAECPDLTYVSLNGSPVLFNELIIALAKTCPNLKTLDISLKAGKSPVAKFGDSALMALIKHSHNLEILRFLYNPNITPVALTALFQSLDSSLPLLQSVSLCVGSGYGCSISVVALHGLKYLTEQSRQQLKDAAATARRNSFMLLHLDFQRRKFLV